MTKFGARCGRSTSGRQYGSFYQEQTFSVAKLNDRTWSEAAVP